MLKISMLEKLRSRVRDLVARIFRREPPEPGRFVIGSNFSWRGWLASHPWIWPSRDYLLYVPRGYGGWRRRLSGGGAGLEAPEALRGRIRPFGRRVRRRVGSAHRRARAHLRRRHEL